MDILRIGNDSMKLILSSDDMNAYSLSCDTISSNRSRAVAAVREILREAGKHCDFPFERSKISVQLYASPKGECEIYVRRLDTSPSASLEFKKSKCEIFISPLISERDVFVYAFKNLLTMMQACRCLLTAEYGGESSAYRDESTAAFYLIIEERSPFPAECGGRLCDRSTAYYINEHCRLICSGAVGTLGRLA